MITTKVKGTLTMGSDNKLTMRVWLSDRAMNDFVMQKGVCPIGQIETIVMDGGEESLESHRESTKGMVKEAD